MIIVDRDGEFTANEAIDLWMTPSSSSAARAALRSGRDACAGRVRVKDGAKPLPRNMSLTVSMFDGSLVLRDKKEVFAVLAKDPEATAAALAAH